MSNVLYWHSGFLNLHWHQSLSKLLISPIHQVTLKAWGHRYSDKMVQSGSIIRRLPIHYTKALANYNLTKLATLKFHYSVKSVKTEILDSQLTSPAVASPSAEIS